MYRISILSTILAGIFKFVYFHESNMYVSVSFVPP